MDSLPARAGDRRRNTIVAGAAAAATSARLPNCNRLSAGVAAADDERLAHARPFRVAIRRLSPAQSCDRRALRNPRASFDRDTRAECHHAELLDQFRRPGISGLDCGPDCEPPDTQMAAGPDQIFEVINVVGKIYDKSGNTAIGGVQPQSSFQSGPRPVLERSENRVRHDFRPMVCVVADSRYQRHHDCAKWFFQPCGIERLRIRWMASTFIPLRRRRLSGSAVARIQRRQGRDRRQLVLVQSQLQRRALRRQRVPGLEQERATGRRRDR